MCPSLYPSFGKYFFILVLLSVPTCKVHVNAKASTDCYLVTWTLADVATITNTVPDSFFALKDSYIRGKINILPVLRSNFRCKLFISFK